MVLNLTNSVVRNIHSKYPQSGLKSKKCSEMWNNMCSPKSAVMVYLMRSVKQYVSQIPVMRPPKSAPGKSCSKYHSHRSEIKLSDPRPDYCPGTHGRIPWKTLCSVEPSLLFFSTPTSVRLFWSTSFFQAIGALLFSFYHVSRYTWPWFCPTPLGYDVVFQCNWL